ncbi:DUF4129 domain-containing protein [Leifsonia sp. NPDC058194]|uniref:DUF4129 domain-containing protein n=1 Tax=Leifsonia sp. NPDC058194 TaxID=3346374 RepID=UPI0036D99187
MTSHASWKRWIVPAAGAVLLVVAAVAVATQGAPTYSPPRITLPDADLRPSRVGTEVTTGTPEPQDAPRVVHLDLSWVAVALIVLALVVIAALVWRYLRRRLRRAPEPPTADLGPVALGEAPPASEEPLPAPVRRGLDRALDALDAGREPRSAIERAWLGLEEGAADSGVRRLPAETPGEFVTRVVARVAPERAAARTLLEIYQRARFGDGPVTAADVQAARDALSALRASWSSPTTVPGAPR